VLADREPLSNSPSCRHFVRVPLAVPKGERVDRIPFGRGQGEQGSGVESTTEKQNGWTVGHGTGAESHRQASRRDHAAERSSQAEYAFSHEATSCRRGPVVYLLASSSDRQSLQTEGTS
jgi:hypothetical protein